MKKTIYEYYNESGIGKIECDEVLFRVAHGLTIPEKKLQILTQYFADYILSEKLKKND